MLGFFLVAFISLFNFWIWRIFSTNFALGLILFISSIIFYFSVLKNSLRVFIFLLVPFLIILFYQYKLTENYDLTYLDNDEQRVQAQRLKEYPLIHLQMLNKNLWIKGENFFEKRKEFLIFMRMNSNFIENLDINRYFFGGYPRQMALKVDFEKFPFIFLPFFILGVLISIKKKNIRIFLPIAISFLLSSYIGNKNKLGLFSLFPFFILFITLGVQKFYQFMRGRGWGKIFIITFTIFTLFAFFQQIIYENS